MTRLLTIMGSGETSPTMVKVHRQLLERTGLPAVVLDTPVGFQENAGEITDKAVAYFRDSVGFEIGVATYRSAAAADAVTTETMLARLREARYVFAGPGSPSYALEQWRSTKVPELLAEKLRTSGGITFASAAALTVGTHTVPVYEIYKAGQDPHWLPGLDLLAEAGLRAAVIPHYDNAEGGNHDTRYCYLGERRLQLMEEQLPDDVFVLGVDEHTACILDLDADTAEVLGLGAVTIRGRDRSVRFEAGTTVPLQHWRDGATAATSDPSCDAEPEPSRPGVTRSEPFTDEVESCGGRFRRGVGGRRRASRRDGRARPRGAHGGVGTRDVLGRRGRPGPRRPALDGDPPGRGGRRRPSGPDGRRRPLRQGPSRGAGQGAGGKALRRGRRHQGPPRRRRGRDPGPSRRDELGALTTNVTCSSTGPAPIV